MQTPAVFASTRTVSAGPRNDVRGSEQESRYGTSLSVVRPTSDPMAWTEVLAEMTGELAQAWVRMTQGGPAAECPPD
jgi:hypothetical protein